MAHYSTTPTTAGMQVPLVFEPSQAFLFGSLDFVADWLGVLHLREEAHVPAPVGGAPSIDSETHDSKQTLCSNPAISNTHAIIYLLFSIFRRLSGGTLLSPPRPPYDWFPYGLASPLNAYAQRL